MPYTQEDRLIALAGVYQCALCVRTVALKGHVDISLMEPCLFSLFQTDSDTVAAVFGEPGSLIPGVRALAGQFSGRQVRNPRDLELTRYVLALLKLERLLARRPDLVKSLAEGIESARAKLNHFSMLHPNLLAHLADLYIHTAGEIPPRILVRGESRHLENPDNQNRIRALLLAGIRSAWLWNQVGGNRWKILFWRRRLLQAVEEYLRRYRH